MTTPPTEDDPLGLTQPSLGQASTYSAADSITLYRLPTITRGPHSRSGGGLGSLGYASPQWQIPLHNAKNNAHSTEALLSSIREKPRAYRPMAATAYGGQVYMRDLRPETRADGRKIIPLYANGQFPQRYIDDAPVRFTIQRRRERKAARADMLAGPKKFCPYGVLKLPRLESAIVEPTTATMLKRIDRPARTPPPVPEKSPPGSPESPEPVPLPVEMSP